MVNNNSNAIFEEIHQFLGNLVRTCNVTETYIDKDDLWSVFLSETAFKIRSTTNRLKYYSLGQIIFLRDMIIPKKHKVDWGLIPQQRKTQINKDNILKNSKIVDHDYKLGDEFVITNNAA